MSDETQFVCPHCKQQIKHCAGMTFGEVMSLRHNKQHQDNLLDRLRAENEKLRAERDLWISRFEEFRKNAARLAEERLKPMRVVGSAAAAALKETDG